MSKGKQFKRIIALILSFAMIFGMMPITAIAEAEEGIALIYEDYIDDDLDLSGDEFTEAGDDESGGTEAAVDGLPPLGIANLMSTMDFAAFAYADPSYVAPLLAAGWQRATYTNFDPAVPERAFPWGFVLRPGDQAMTITEQFDTDADKMVLRFNTANRTGAAMFKKSFSAAPISDDKIRIYYDFRLESSITGNADNQIYVAFHNVENDTLSVNGQIGLAVSMRSDGVIGLTNNGSISGDGAFAANPTTAGAGNWSILHSTTPSAWTRMMIEIDIVAKTASAQMYDRATGDPIGTAAEVNIGATFTKIGRITLRGHRAAGNINGSIDIDNFNIFTNSDDGSVTHSTVNPTTASYDKNGGTAPSTTLTLNGNMLTSITNGATTLTQSTDYTISGNVYTIGATYLNAQPTGTVTLRFNMSAGTNPTFAITVTDSAPVVTKYDFGDGGTVASEHISVKANTAYTDATGYGLLALENMTSDSEDAAYYDGFRFKEGQKTVVQNGQSGAISDIDDYWVATQSPNAGDNPFYVYGSEVSMIRFGHKIPDNNHRYYDVTVKLVRHDKSKDAIVNLFTGRKQLLLMEENIPVGGLEFKFSSYVLSAHDRNATTINDVMLSIVAEGLNVGIASIEVTGYSEAHRPPVLWVFGDSTTTDGNTPAPYFNLTQYTGTGSGIPYFLKQGIAVSKQPPRQLHSFYR